MTALACMGRPSKRRPSYRSLPRSTNVPRRGINLWNIRKAPSMPFAPRVLALALLLLICRPLAAQDNPEEILKPSVVAIRNDECAGSGMFLDDSGLILTNAHVACSPLPYRVHALATVKRVVKEVVFRKVAVLGFHPEYDLALLKVDLAEQDATVKPVAIAS